MLKSSFTLLSIFIFAFSFGQTSNGYIDVISENFSLSGDWCSGDLTLTADFSSLKADFSKKEGTWFWFKNDVKIEGENTNSLNLTKYGKGKFTVQFVTKDNTSRFQDIYEITKIDGPQSSFSFDYFYAAGAVRFFDTSIDQSSKITTWAWDFGNGKTSIIKNPEVIYSAEGDYVVTLTTTNAEGCSNKITYSIHWEYPKK